MRLRMPWVTMLLLAVGLAVSSHATDLARPDAHAPIGVMGDHVHSQGEWMVSYRTMRMSMDGNLDGRNGIGTSEILRPTGRFLVTPTRMNMEMHMFGAMYAPRDWITLTFMLPYVRLDMDHVTATGAKFTTRSEGIGDIQAGTLIKLLDLAHHELHLNAAVSFPSGSLDRKDDTPASMGADVILPYPMQLGSGTVDLRPGLTYNGQLEHFSWGAQALGTLRLGRNSEGYRLGHGYDVTAWSAVRLTPWLSLSGRGAWRQTLDIQGRDDRLSGPPGVRAEDFVPTADPMRRAGRRLDLGPGFNVYVPSGPFKGIRLGVEALFPVYQDLDGPQLELDWTVTAGLQYSF